MVVDYFVFVDNPYRPGAGRLFGTGVHNHADGSFRLVGLPGRGLVAARAEKDQYLVGVGAEKIGGRDGQGRFMTDPRICQTEQFHIITEIAPAEGDESLRCDLMLDPGKTRSGTVLDAEGQALAGCIAINLRPGTMSPSMVTLTSASFSAQALDPQQPRPLFFRHDQKKLAAVVMARGDEEGPLTVCLQPSGTLTGRLLDGEGRPRTRVTVGINYTPRQFGPRYDMPFLNPTLDSGGRFKIEGMIPGVSHILSVSENEQPSTEFARGVTLKPGESRDMGDVRITTK